jgi:hypothetical protein
LLFTPVIKHLKSRNIECEFFLPEEKKRFEILFDGLCKVNIITKEDIPKSWINYSKLILNVTQINKYKILIYNKRYNKFTNVIDIDNQEENINITTNYTITIAKRMSNGTSWRIYATCFSEW